MASPSPNTTGKPGAARTTWRLPRRSSENPTRPALEEKNPMDPLTLLRELYGEEPVRKLVTSGFDSVEKIASATADSLSFFAGLNETLARQIVESAADLLTAPQAAGYRGTLAGSTAAEGEGRTPAPPVKLKVPETALAHTRAGEPRGRSRPRPLDD